MLYTWGKVLRRCHTLCRGNCLPILGLQSSLAIYWDLHDKDSTAMLEENKHDPDKNIAVNEILSNMAAMTSSATKIGVVKQVA